MADRYTEPHWNAAAIVTIDTQVDTLDGQAIAIRGTAAILPAMVRLLSAARRARRPIVHVVRLYERDGRNVDLCRRARVEAGWRPLAPGSPGSELAPALRGSPDLRLDSRRLLRGDLQALAPREWALYKPRWSAFYGTPLDDHLHALGIDTVVVAGCNYPNCPRATLFDATERDYRVVLITDAVSRLDARGIREMAAIGVVPLPARAVCAALTRASGAAARAGSSRRRRARADARASRRAARPARDSGRRR